MLKIKLTRLGKKKEPRYRIVVNECRDKRDGSYVAALGFYHPAEQPKLLELDLKAFDEWVAKGAIPTSTVAYIYEIAKAGKGFPEKKKKLSKKVKAKLAAEKQAKEEAKEAVKVAPVAAPAAESSKEPETATTTTPAAAKVVTETKTEEAATGAQPATSAEKKE